MPILSFLNSNNNRNHNPTKRMRVGGFGWTSAQLLELNHICQPNTWGSCAYPPSVFGHRYRPTHILDTKKMLCSHRVKYATVSDVVHSVGQMFCSIHASQIPVLMRTRKNWLPHKTTTTTLYQLLWSHTS